MANRESSAESDGQSLAEANLQRSAVTALENNSSEYQIMTMPKMMHLVALYVGKDDALTVANF